MNKMNVNSTEVAINEEQLTAAAVVADDLMFEELEQRIVPISGGCATSSSCTCSSSSCVIMA